MWQAMAVLQRDNRVVAATPRPSTKGRVVWRWLTTTDHKVIGNLYFVTSMGFFMFGGVLALGIRAELAHPGLQFLSYETYNQLDRKSTRLNSSHMSISYAVFCLKKKNKQKIYK